MQTDETALAFEAFAIYRDTGPGRSVRAVAEKMGKDQALLERWCTVHAWVRRSRSYDADLDRRKQLVDLREVESMRKRQIQISLKLQALGVVELDRTLERALEDQSGSAGEPIDPALIVKLIEAGAKLERLNRGEPGEISQRNEGSTTDLSSISTDKLLLLRQVRAELRQKQLAADVVDAEGETVDEERG